MATDRIKNGWNQASRLVGPENFRHTVHTFMKRARNRRPRQRAPRAAAPSSAQFQPRPEFLNMDDRHLIWRAPLRPTPGLPLRLITWDLQFRENEVVVRADLDRESDIRPLPNPPPRRVRRCRPPPHRARALGNRSNQRTEEC